MQQNITNIYKILKLNDKKCQHKEITNSTQIYFTSLYSADEARRGSDTERGSDAKWNSGTSPYGYGCGEAATQNETAVRLLVAVVAVAATERRGEGEERRWRGGEREGHDDDDREKSNPLWSASVIHFVW
jgi:hypothetical protein